MTPNDSKSYLTYLNKLVDGYNNNYQHFINNKLINADSSPLPEKFDTNPKAPKFKAFTLESQSLKVVLVEVELKIGQEKY